MQNTTETHIEEFRYPLVNQRDGVNSCWFRMLNSENRPLVVLCSQRGNRGISICNGHEFFREQFRRLLEIKRAHEDAVAARNNFATIKGYLKPSLISMIDVMLPRYFKKDACSRFGRDSFWFEHWPENRTLSKREEYWAVTLSKEAQSEEAVPKFSQTTIEEISDATGYSLRDICFSFQST